VEIKQLSAQLASIKSDINRQEDLLEECATYKTFLAQLTPQTWLQVRPAIKLQFIKSYDITVLLDVCDLGLCCGLPHNTCSSDHSLNAYADVVHP
jgi:hypothetical protein